LSRPDNLFGKRRASFAFIPLHHGHLAPSSRSKTGEIDYFSTKARGVAVRKAKVAANHAEQFQVIYLIQAV
jgi:hypothetical protein